MDTGLCITVVELKDSADLSLSLCHISLTGTVNRLKEKKKVSGTET